MSCLIFCDMLDATAIPWLELPENSSLLPSAVSTPPQRSLCDELACAVAMTPVAGVRTGKVSPDGAGSFSNTA